MNAILTVALAAGLASALMFASIVSGAPVSALLLHFAPLPLMVVALGRGPLAAVISGIIATLALTPLADLALCISFVVGVALPAVWLGHLAMLGRPVGGTTTGNAADLEWYPVGRILIWTAVIAIPTAVAILLRYGADIEAIAETARQIVREIARRADVDWTPAQIAFHAKLVAYLVPLVAPASVILTLTLNLWLAAKIAMTSGHLHRPWPELRSVVLPPITLAILATAVAFCFVGGTFGMLAATVAGALLFAYAIVGFAVLHILTSSASNRTFWLACVYVLAVLFYVPALVMTALGIADAVFGLRQRYLQTRPPPLPAA